MRYYAIATDKNDTTQLIVDLPEDSRINALNTAMDYCKKVGLTFKELRPVAGTERQNGTLSKTIESKRGRKVFWKF